MLAGCGGFPVVTPEGPFVRVTGLVLFGGLPGFAVVGADFDTGDKSRSIEGDSAEQYTVFPAVFTRFFQKNAIVGVPGAIALDLAQ